MRADRNGNTFALLILSPQAAATESDLVNSLEHALADRFRATDIAGFLENRKVAVLLPDTQSEGAHTLAKDVCSLLPDKRDSAEMHGLRISVRSAGSSACG